MPTVTFTEFGRTYEVPAGTSFLDLCQDNGAPHQFGCTVGSCGTCRLEIVAGAEHVDPASDDEKETVSMCSDVDGARLGCQLIVRGDLSVRAVD